MLLNSEKEMTWKEVALSYWKALFCNLTGSDEESREEIGCPDRDSNRVRLERHHYTNLLDLNRLSSGIDLLCKCISTAFVTALLLLGSTYTFVRMIQFLTKAGNYLAACYVHTYADTICSEPIKQTKVAFRRSS
jgi:hypothetical protein